MRNAVLRAALLLLLVAPGSLARADEQFAARNPPAELRSLQFLVGDFTCKGTWYPTAGAPGLHRTAKLRSSWALDDLFVTFDYTRPKSTEQPGPIAVRGFWGWDADFRQYVHGIINSLGMSLLLHGDKEGDALVFRGDGRTRGGGRGPLVFTFKKTDNGFTITVEDAGADNKLTKASEEACTR